MYHQILWKESIKNELIMLNNDVNIIDVNNDVDIIYCFFLNE